MFRHGNISGVKFTEVLSVRKNQRETLAFKELEKKTWGQKLTDRFTRAEKTVKASPTHPFEQLKSLPVADLLVVLAHPDDEMLFSGTLSTLAKQGQKIQVVYVTSGDKGPDYTQQNLKGEALAKVREDEGKQALKKLGIKIPPVFLNFPDGAVKHQSMAIEDALSQVLATTQPRLIISFGLDGWTAHPDHIAVGKQVRNASKQSQPPVPMYQAGLTADAIKWLDELGVSKSFGAFGGFQTMMKSPPDVSVNVSTRMTKKRVQSLSAHKTQIDDTLLKKMTDFMHRFPYEFFTKAE